MRSYVLQWPILATTRLTAYTIPMTSFDTNTASLPPCSLPELVEVRISTRDSAEANRIADLLVEKRLAAGVNIIPGVRSVYRWNGAVRRHEECLLLAQSTQERFNALEVAVRAAHSYETPNISAVPLCNVSPDFARWIHDMTKAATQPHTAEELGCVDNQVATAN